MELILSILLTLILVCCLSAVAYSQIVAPTILRRLQFRLFEVRDTGRKEMIEQRISREEFEFIEDRCNFTISLIEIIDPVMMFKISKFIKGLSAEQKTKLDKEIDRFKDSQFVSESMGRIALVIRKAMVANAGCWGILIWSVVFLSRWIISIKKSRVMQAMVFNTKEIAAAFPTSAIEQLRRHPGRPVRIAV